MEWLRKEKINKVVRYLPITFCSHIRLNYLSSSPTPNINICSTSIIGIGRFPSPQTIGVYLICPRGRRNWEKERNESKTVLHAHTSAHTHNNLIAWLRPFQNFFFPSMEWFSRNRLLWIVPQWHKPKRWWNAIY